MDLRPFFGLDVDKILRGGGEVVSFIRAWPWYARLGTKNRKLEKLTKNDRKIEK